MRKKNIPVKSAPDWWLDFYRPDVGEIVFPAQAGSTSAETAQVLRQTRLKLPADVLELACGYGFHSQALAAEGFVVTGLDYSKSYLRSARAVAKIAERPARFIHGDLRNLKPHFAANSFDLVLSLYSSFGHFDKRSDDSNMLREAYRVVKPGGWFVINTLNEGGVLQSLKEPISVGSYEPLPNALVIDEALYDRHARKTICRCTIAHIRRDKPRLFRGDFRQNVYSHAELKRLLKRAGFTVVTTWGPLAGGRFDPKKSWHQTIAARKCG